MAPVTLKEPAEKHNIGSEWIKALARIFMLFAFVLFVYFTAGVTAGQLVPWLSPFIWHMPI